LEFIQDKATKTPFLLYIEFGSKVQLAAFELGVALYSRAGTADSIKGDHILIASLYTILDAELEVIVTVLKNAYNKIVIDIL
jgi:adenosylmethionine-8-amino-7-oxononanoate aminotransferase